MREYKKGEKYYIEVEIDFQPDNDRCWVYHPEHPSNEYSTICVYTKDLIPIEHAQQENRKEQE